MLKSSTLKSSVKRKQTFKKAKIAANNMSFIKKESSNDKMSVPNFLWRNITKTTTPKRQLRAIPVKISTEERAYIFTEMRQPLLLESSVKKKRVAKKTKVEVDTLLASKKKSTEDKTSQSNSLGPNITTTKSQKSQLRARPVEVSTEMRQPSTLKFSMKGKQKFKKSKIVASNMSSIKKKSSKNKTLLSNSLGPNVTKTRTPKPQQRVRPIEISTVIYKCKPQPSQLESSVKAKQTAKKSALAVDKMLSTKKESSNDKKSRSNPLGKIATNPVKSNYYLRSKNMGQIASSKSFVDEKKISKNLTTAVKKVQSRKKVTAKVKKLPSNFPRKDVIKAKILNFIFRPKYMPQLISLKSTVTEKKTTKKVRFS